MERANLPRQLGSVQALRAVAALLVVVVHAINVSDNRGDWGKGFLASHPAVNEFGAIGVDIFFVISGLVMARSILGPGAVGAGRFLRQRYQRVIPLYWIATVAMLAIRYSFDTMPGLGTLIESITVLPVYMPSVFGMPTLDVGWTLAFEMAFYLVVALSIAVCGNRRNLPGVLLGIVLTLALIGTIGTPSLDLFAIFANGIWFEFAAGIVIAILLERRPALLGRNAGIAAVIVAFAWFGALMTWGFPFEATPHALMDESAGMPRAVLWGIPAALLVFGSIGAFEGRSCPFRPAAAAGRLLGRLGDASYALYLSHMLVIYVCQRAMPPVVHYTDLFVLAALVFCSALALLLHAFIEKPVMRAMKRDRDTTGSSAFATPGIAAA